MAIGGPVAILAILGVVAGAVLTVMIFVYILVPILKGIGWLIGKFFWLIGAGIAHVFRFIAGMFRDTFRAVGAVPAGLIFALLSVGSVVIGRWSSAAHFATNMSHEFKTLAACIYRVALGHPLRLIGLHVLLEGIEQRVPAALAEAPGADKPSRRVGKFDGYEIVGSLPGGGSGGKLYIAVPSIEKSGQISKAIGYCPERVVIKAFAIGDGSSLPQIVRESRALECAKQLRLILDHELTNERFFYAMPYVPGESLTAVTRHLHTKAGQKGLSDESIRVVLAHVGDVLETLEAYHRGGLWHKDIKPENIIVSDGKAHVVDLGLVTPLRSAMTLTTHGTEYFRDPEMVRMALRGVKVHEVDGAKFDIYAAGAVLFYLLENTFPSHGGLSTITKRCPEPLKWVVRRAMTDYTHRYASAGDMAADIREIASRPNMFAMKPAELPSVSGQPESVGPAGHDLHAAAFTPPGVPPTPADQPAAPSAPGSPGPMGAFGAAAFAATPEISPPRTKPHLKVTNWWTGAYRPTAEHGMPHGAAAGAAAGTPGHLGSEIKSAVRQAAADARAAVEQVRADIHNRKAGTSRLADVKDASAKAFNARPPRGGSPAGLPAHEQVRRARQRAAELRRRARDRVGARRRSVAPGERVTPGVVVASVVVLGLIAVAMGGAFSMLSMSGASSRRMSAGTLPNTPPIPQPGGQVFDDTDRQGERASSNAGIIEMWTGTEKSVVINSDASEPTIDPEALRQQVGIELPAEFPMGFLLINDHPHGESEQISSHIRSIHEQMGLIGFELKHDGEGEALVRARAHQWLSGPYSITPGEELDRAEDAVGILLGTDIQDVGCVVWLYPTSRNSSDVGYWVITPDAPRSKVDDRILDYLWN